MKAQRNHFTNWPGAGIRSGVVVIAMTVALSLAGCSAPAASIASAQATSVAQTEAAATFLDDHRLAGMDAAQIIEKLDHQPVSERPTNLLASVTPEALVLTDDQNRKVSLEMPQDEVYVSVAPFVSQTHDCFFHSLTTCRGEIANKDLTIKITDANGKVLVDQVQRSYDNGFIGFWLPRGTESTLTVTVDGKSGTRVISTKSAQDPTCIADLQLTS